MEFAMGTLGKSSVQRGFARGVEGARALGTALAQLPLEELQLYLDENELGPGPRGGKGAGPGARSSERRLWSRIFPSGFSPKSSVHDRHPGISKSRENCIQLCSVKGPELWRSHLSVSSTICSGVEPRNPLYFSAPARRDALAFQQSSCESAVQDIVAKCRHRPG